MSHQRDPWRAGIYTVRRTKEELRRTRWLPGSDLTGKARPVVAFGGGGEASGQWPENSAHIPVLPVSGWMTLAPRPPVFLDCNLIFSHVGRGRAWTMGLSVLLLR